MDRILTRTLTAVLLVSACTSVREDPRNSTPANQPNQNPSDGGGGSGTGGSSSGGESSGGESSSGGASTGGAGGAASVAVAKCACGMAAVLKQNLCGECIEANETSLTPQCDFPVTACANSLGCSGALLTIGNCAAPNAACFNSLSGTIPEGDLVLLSNLFDCLCASTVCGSVCEPGGPAFSCELTAKPPL